MPDDKVSRSATLDDLKKIIKSLNENNAEYILIGGYALYSHGYHRATDDIDLLIPKGGCFARPVIDALLVLEDKESGNLDPKWFDDGDTIRLADEIVVDLMFSACGETYQSLNQHVITIDVDGLAIKTLDLEGLLKTKQTVREKDVMDRILLERAIQITQDQSGESAPTL